MAAVVLALAASVSWGIADFIGGVKSRKVPVLTLMVLAHPVGLVVLGVVVAVRGEGPPGSEVLFAVPAAVLGTMGIAAFYKGMAIGEISIVAPVAATSALIPVGIGIAAGDRPSAAQIAGFALAIAGVVAAASETDAERRRLRLAAGVGWALVAAVGFGGYFVPMHAASEHDFLWASLVFRASSTTIVLAAWLAVRPAVPVGRQDLLAILAIGLFDTGGNAFFAAAASSGLVSVTSVLSSLYPVITVALAWIYLRERIGGLQRVGVAVALGGVVLISAG